MSDQEFDNYLALLSHLLRLDSRQEKAIAGELRAHLEDRLEELLARGVPRQEAVRQALAEFGDAAGLAAEFVSLSRNRRRRWLMRITTASVAATLLVAAGIITFWPGTNAGPGAATLIAQDPNRPAAEEKPSLNPSEGTLLAETDLSAKLNRRMDAEFNETPLVDCIAFLADQSGVQFYLKRSKLEEAGITIDTPITKNLKKIRLSTLLDLMLDELNLVYVEKDELLVITTPEDAEATMEVRVYDCRDLVSMPAVTLPGQEGTSGKTIAPTGSGAGIPSTLPGGSVHDPLGIPTLNPDAAPVRGKAAGEPAPPGKEILPQLGGIDPAAADSAPSIGGSGMGGLGGGMGMGGGARLVPASPADQLIAILTTTVDPNSWVEVGGPGSIAEYNGLFVISQSARTHAKVEKVLDMLRKAADLPQPKNPRVVR
jgi:hypothetical protein